ncbi:hypothetical protein IG631_14981 [Alternaria alternata]|nr:hypothetical protein IG631_14981 [Alternaria alternata]
MMALKPTSPNASAAASKEPLLRAGPVLLHSTLRSFSTNIYHSNKGKCNEDLLYPPELYQDLTEVLLRHHQDRSWASYPVIPLHPHLLGNILFA